MTGDEFILLNATIPWSLAGFFLSGAAITLVLLRAIRQAEVGYEDETGFHYGNFNPSSGGKGSRPAKPLRGHDVYSCDHSKSRENKRSRHGSRQRHD